MSLSKKQIRILIALVLILFISIMLILFFKNKNNVENIKQLVDKQETKEIITPKAKVLDSNEKLGLVSANDSETKLSVLSIARNFTERYGTWSNHNKGQNFLSAQVYMTEKMLDKLNNFIDDNEYLNGNNSEYYGVTTKVLNSKIISVENDIAQVLINVQEVVNNKDPEYKKLELRIIKSGEKWLVDDIRYY